MTNIELEKNSHSDKHIFIEEGMRGGICYAATKYSKANNEFCFDYDNTKPRTEIKYYETNNLYGKAMMQYLPYKDFKWVKASDKNFSMAPEKLKITKDILSPKQIDMISWYY